MIHAHTSLRGVAAAAVVIGHYTAVFCRDVGGYDLFVPRTHLGVDLFFLLSGYILYRNYAATFAKTVTAGDWRAFMARRLARIYPLHLLTLLAVIVLVRGDLPANAGWLLGLNLTLTHAWGLTDQFEFNSPSWSISCEFAAYLVFPFLARSFGRAAGRWAAGVAVLLAAGALWRLGQGSLDLDAIGRRAALLRAVAAFPAGMLLAWVAGAHASWLARRAAAMQVGALAAILCGFVFGLPDVPMVGLFAALVLATSVAQGPVVRCLDIAPLRWLGDISYSLYLIQWPLMLLNFSLRPKLQAILPVSVFDGVCALLFIVMLLGLSHLSFQLFERPVMRWARGPRRAARLPT